MKKLIDALCGSNKKTVIEHVSSENNILVDDYEAVIYYQPPRNKPSNTLKLLKKWYYQKYLS